MNALILIGATAAGKTAVCQRIAEQTNAAILSFDAMLVYKGMDIGTAKPSLEEQRRARYLGIDLFTPAENSNALLWLDAVRKQFAALPQNTPIIATGGTGLYLRALLAPFDAPPPSPESRARWQNVFETSGLAALQNALRERLAPEIFDSIPDPKNPRRLMRLLERLDAGEDFSVAKKPRPAPRVIGLAVPREMLRQRIADRVHTMIKNGFVEEVRELRKNFPVWSATAGAAIGYEEINAHLDGKISLAAAIERTVIRTRQLAKRQFTWFQHQLDPIWIESNPNEPVETLAARVQAAWRQHGATKLTMNNAQRTMHDSSRDFVNC